MLYLVLECPARGIVQLQLTRSGSFHAADQGRMYPPSMLFKYRLMTRFLRSTSRRSGHAHLPAADGRRGTCHRLDDDDGKHIRRSAKPPFRCRLQLLVTLEIKREPRTGLLRSFETAIILLFGGWADNSNLNLAARNSKEPIIG